MLSMILWTVIGVFVLLCLNNDGYLDSVKNAKTMAIVCGLCGPIGWVIFIFATIVAFIESLIDWMDR